MMQIIEFCKLINRLKHFPCARCIRHNIDQSESVAGHMYRMALLAFCLDDKSVKFANADYEHEKRPLDRLKCIKMALVHNLADSLVDNGISSDDKCRQETEDKFINLTKSDLQSTSKSMENVNSSSSIHQNGILSATSATSDIDNGQSRADDVTRKSTADSHVVGKNNQSEGNVVLANNNSRPGGSADFSSQDDGENIMQIMEFCKLIHRLKHLPRTGWLRHNIDQPESVAGHMYRMALLAFCLDDKSVKFANAEYEHEKRPLDRLKCIKMALVHDLAESIVGDITPHCGVSSEEKYRQEKEGMEHIATLLPGHVGAEMYDLWRDYESQSSREARLVKQLDKFDLMAQAFEYEQDFKKPGFLTEFFNSGAKQAIRDEPVLGWTRQLMLQRQKHMADGANEIKVPKPEPEIK